MTPIEADFEEVKEKGLRTYLVYAVYGNKVVSAYAREDVLSMYWDLLKDKIILANKKPYILNGD